MRERYSFGVQSSERTATDSADRVFACLSTLFERLACAGKSSTMDVVAQADLTFSQFRAMMELGTRTPAMSVNELADAVHLSVAATGRVVDKLVGLGFADRREDPADRRVKRVSLTEDGHRFVTAAADARADVLHDFSRRLPPELADDLTAALRPIVDAETDYFTP